MIGQEVMEISDIRVKILNLNSKIKAIAAITIDGCFVVHDLKVIQGADNLFVAMPGRKTADGKYNDIAHPIDTQTRTMLSESVLDAYEKALQENPDAAEEAL